MRARAHPSILVLALCAFVSGAETVAAQSAGPVPEAEAVATRLLTALDSARWRAAASLFHPMALEGFRRTQIERAEMMSRTDSASRRWYGPDTPPEVAAWLARRDSQARAHFSNGIVRDFAGLMRRAQLDSLAADDLLARWLEAHDERTQLRAATAQVPPAMVRMFVGDTTNFVRRRVVGSVGENDSTAHVVIRTGSNIRVMPGDPGRVALLTLRRTPAGWRVWNSDPSVVWLGDNGSFSFSVQGDTRAHVAESLDALRDSTLAWRDPAVGTRVRASVVGYPGGGKPPRGLLLEVRAPNGALRSVELPYGSLADLMEYAMPWIVMPPLAAAQAPD
jgi:hypothetical protein